MKLWRVISVISSILLTLLFIAFAIGLGSYFYLNQQLKSIGVTDWHIEFEQLAASHIIIKRLEVTIDSLPQSTTKKPLTALNLTQMFSVEMPALLPERIDIKSLHLKGTLLPDEVSATLKLLNQDQLLLQANSHQPIVADLEMLRSNGSVQLKARYDNAVLHASYDYRSGQLKADGSYLFAAQQFAGEVSTEQLPVTARWRGNFSPDIGSTTLENLTSALSGELLLSVKDEAEIMVIDSSTTATGQIEVGLNNGIINSYRLELDGESENLTSLTGSELPVQLASLSWHLNSSNRLALPLLDAQHALNRTHWPIRLNALAKGEKGESIDISAVADFSNIDYPYSEPQKAFAEFDLNLQADVINFDPLPNIKVAFDSEFRYQQQQLTGDGELLLGDHIRLQHHSQINATQLKSRVELASFNWQQTAQLNELLKHLAPQLVISKATIRGQTDMNLFWDKGLWELDNGFLEINKSDWVADTVSVVDSSLDFEFTANNKLLNVDNAKLHISSLQQGFTLGPITAEFGLQLPFQYPRQSTLNLTSHSIKGFGGSISIPNQSYSLVSNFALPVVFEEISLGELMRQYPSNKISIDGKVSGTLPVHWDSKQFTVERGYIDALAPGGHLQVDSSALVSVAGDNPSLRTLAGVLSNFYYQQLSTVIDYDQNGKLMLGIQLKGSNPEVENGRPVELNVNLEEDLPALLKGLTLSNSLNEVIRKRVQQKIN